MISGISKSAVQPVYNDHPRDPKSGHCSEVAATLRVRRKFQLYKLHFLSVLSKFINILKSNGSILFKLKLFWIFTKNFLEKICQISKNKFGRLGKNDHCRQVSMIFKTRFRWLLVVVVRSWLLFRSRFSTKIVRDGNCWQVLVFHRCKLAQIWLYFKNKIHCTKCISRWLF